MSEARTHQMTERDKLPLEGPALAAFLKNKLDATSAPEIRGRFERTYEKLSEAANAITAEYNDLLKQSGLKPGEIRLYMVGGRLKGKPLKKDSDIDLMFMTENPQAAASALQFQRFENPIDAFDFRILLQQQILGRIDITTKELNIPNLFHVLEFGGSFIADTPSQSDTHLLLSVFKPGITSQ